MMYVAAKHDLDGPPPAVPSPAPIPTSHKALTAFEQAAAMLKPLAIKPVAQFVNTTYSAVTESAVPVSM